MLRGLRTRHGQVRSLQPLPDVVVPAVSFSLSGIVEALRTNRVMGRYGVKPPTCDAVHDRPCP